MNREEIIEELRNKNAELRDELEEKNAELNEEKEKNKKYIVQLTDPEYRRLVDVIKADRDKEWKDKIKAKIEYNKTFNDDIHKYTTLTLEELSEEE